MENSALKKNRIRILLTVLTLAVMTQIFLFSTETAERSDETSGRFSRKVIDVLYPEFDQYTPERQQELYDEVQHAVRKTAHFSEYMLLGIMIRLCLESWFGRKRWLCPVSWLAGTLYACTDEMHQILTDGRSGQWTDVLLDSAGVLAGVLAVLLITTLIRRKSRQEG